MTLPIKIALFLGLLVLLGGGYFFLQNETVLPTVQKEEEIKITSSQNIELIVEETSDLLIESGINKNVAPARTIHVQFYGHFDIWGDYLLTHPEAGIPAWVDEGVPYVNYGDGTPDEKAIKRVCPDAPGQDVGCVFEMNHTYEADERYTVTVYTLGQKDAGDDGRLGTKRTLAKSAITVSSLKTQKIALGETDWYRLDIPGVWSVQNKVDNAYPSAVQSYIYDEVGALVMIVRTPIKEIGYEPMSVIDEGTLKTGIGSLSLQLRTNNDAPDSGFAHYMWDGDGKFDVSIEIQVPFRSGLYAKTAQEQKTGKGDVVKLSSLEDFRRERAMIEGIISTLRNR